MINISHVKKYEQTTLPLLPGKIKIRLILAFLVLTNIFYCTYAKNELPQEISEEYYKKEAILKFNEAVKKWEEKNTSEAIVLWKKALEIDSTLWVCHLGLAQAYEAQEEFTKALDSYKKYLEVAPSAAQDRKSVEESIEYLSHLLKHGESALKGEDYLSLVKTKHEGRDLYVRWDLSKPLKIYFYPAKGVPHYRSKFQDAFLEGGEIWKEALPNLKLEVIDNSVLSLIGEKERDKLEKELTDQAQIKVVFPSRFKIKGDSVNPLAENIDAYSFPIIRDKKNFRVLGKIMISPYIYHQVQIAVPLEPLSKLDPDKQIKKLKIIGAREVGHALGLWGFSPNPKDLLSETEVTKLILSDRDKNTLKKLYSLDAGKNDILTNN